MNRLSAIANAFMFIFTFAFTGKGHCAWQRAEVGR